MPLPLAALAFLASGCSTLGRLSVDVIRYGWSQTQVLKEVGQPDSRGSEVKGEQDWVYLKDGNRCVVRFTQGRVLERPRCLTEERKREIEWTAEVRSDPVLWKEVQQQQELEWRQKR